MLPTFGEDLALAATVIVLGSALIALWAHLRWKKLRPEIFPKPADDTSTTSAIASLALQSIDVLRMAHGWLASKDSPAAGRALSALAGIEGSPPSVEALAALFAEALKSDDVASILLRHGDDYCYIVVVPDRYELGRGISRYRGFAEGWRTHVRSLHDKLCARTSAVELVVFLFFLDPGGGESALLLSFADTHGINVPAALAGAAARVPGGDPGGDDLSMEFRLAA